MRNALRNQVRLLALTASVVLAVPASAQGFFESLFGGGSTPAPQAAPRQQLPQPVQSPYGYRAPYYNPFRTSGPREGDDNPAPQSRAGSYRTMCVRLCDGFYWPLNHNISRASFYRDANACRSSCGVEARLFYHTASDGDAGQMVDLQGRAYSKLATAFKFRKAQVEGCRCKPEPWAQSEMNRHRMYELNESAEERQRRIARFAHVMTPTGPSFSLSGDAVIAAAASGHQSARAVAGDTQTPAAPTVAAIEAEPLRVRKSRAEKVVDVPRESVQRANAVRPQSARAVAAQPPQPSGLFGGAFSNGGGGSRWPGDR